ncbi:MAG: hypothetical protein ACOYOL_07125 [Chthoniobacterales bacterium]
MPDIPNTAGQSSRSLVMSATNKYGYVFTAPKTGSIDRLGLYVTTAGGTDTILTIKVYASGGSNDFNTDPPTLGGSLVANLLSEWTLAATTDVGYVQKTLSSAFSVVAGETYLIQFERASGTGNAQIAARINGRRGTAVPTQTLTYGTQSARNYGPSGCWAIYSDGEAVGQTITGLAVIATLAAAVNYRTFNAAKQWVGVKIRPRHRCRLYGVNSTWYNQGSPGSLKAELYRNGTLVATATNVQTLYPISSTFPCVSHSFGGVVLDADADYVVAYSHISGDASNYWFPYGYLGNTGLNRNFVGNFPTTGNKERMNPVWSAIDPTSGSFVNWNEGVVSEGFPWFEAVIENVL